jgi:hypothetical protein
MSKNVFVKEMLTSNELGELNGGGGSGQDRITKNHKQERVWGRMKLIMVETGLDTTDHGIPNILGNPMWSFKLMWTVRLVASCGVCGYLLARSVNDYLSYEVMTTIRKVSDSPSIFPTVTLCNMNFVTNQLAFNYIKEKMDSDESILWTAVSMYDYIRY